MDKLNERIETYFETRTKSHQGVIADYIQVPEKHHSVLLCHNDYLNLAQHPDAIQQQIADLQQSAGKGLVMSSTFLDAQDPQYVLERDMASWFGKDCHLAQSGYAANAGLVQAICSPGTHVYIDKMLHMSFHDALTALKVSLHYVRHNDADHLEASIAQHGPGIILVESVYSSLGDCCPLAQVVAVKQKHGCVLVVDESHSLGVCHGKGFAHMLGLEDEVDYVTASLAKGYATRAGVVFGPRARFVKELAHPHIFSSGLTSNDIVRIRAIWEAIRGADDGRLALAQAAQSLRRELAEVADLVGVGGYDESPIIAVRARDEREMVDLHRHLSRQGVLAAPFFSPATPAKSPVLRLSVHSDITWENVMLVKGAVADFFVRAGSDRSRADFRARL